MNAYIILTIFSTFTPYTIHIIYSPHPRLPYVGISTLPHKRDPTTNHTNFNLHHITTEHPSTT